MLFKKLFKKKNRKKERKKKYIRREYIINCALQTTGDIHVKRTEGPFPQGKSALLSRCHMPGTVLGALWGWVFPIT